VRSIVSDVAAGRAATLSELTQVATALDRFLPQMNRAVQMLVAYQVTLPEG